MISCKKNEGPARKAFNDKSIQNGYFGEQSYYTGANARLYISSDTTYEAATLNAYDVNGGLAFKIPFERIHHQIPKGEAPYESGFTYTDPITFKVPEVKSGVYLIANQIPLVVKARDEKVDFTVVYPLNTENAYCQAGGRSLYTSPVAKKVSFFCALFRILHMVTVF